MISPDIWANAARLRLQTHFAQIDAAPVVIDDLRFPNDWQVVSDFGGKIIRVRRPSVEPSRTVADEIYYRLRLGQAVKGRGLFGWKPLHETEFHWRDATNCEDVWNLGTVDELARAALALIG
jgi:hypothetical protein